MEFARSSVLGVKIALGQSQSLLSPMFALDVSDIELEIFDAYSITVCIYDTVSVSKARKSICAAINQE
jgi:hypothetical protein